MKELYQLFDHPIIHQLGWTLMHFLWQGTGVAVVYALIHILLRKQAPQWRYLLGCGALVVMLAAPITTFIVIGAHPKFRPSASMIGTPVEPAVAARDGAVLDFGGARSVTGEVGAGAAPKFEGFIRGFVLTWLVGVSALSLRLLLASRQVSRLRRSGAETLGEYWTERIDRLRAALAISRPVSLVKSAMIEVPTLIGWLRPVILLPASSLTGLTPAQFETIIAHELAHVRRHDYLVNLLQNAVETLLFYHPAVWWVSNSVRVERENCCDDMALNVCGDRLVYARALATLEQLRSSPAALALGADGGSLLERVRRLCGTPTRSSFGGRRKAGGALAAALVMVILMSLFGHQPGIADAEAKPQSGTHQPKPEPVPEWFNVKALSEWIADLQRTLLNDADSQVRATAAGALNRIEADSSAAQRAAEEAQQLLKARDEARLKAAAAEKRLTESGAPVGSLGFDRARVERDRFLAAAKDSREKLAPYYRYANEAKRLERTLEDEVVRGVRPVDVREIARFERLQAEVELAQAQGRLATGAPKDTISDSSKPPVLEMRLVLEGPSADAQQMKLQQKINNTTAEETLYVQRKVLFDQTGVKSASVTKDPVAGHPLIEVRLTDQGRERFAEVTRQNINRRLAIIIDGRLYSAPRIMQEIPGGVAQISGDFSEDEARDLARRISEAVAK